MYKHSDAGVDGKTLKGGWVREVKIELAAGNVKMATFMP